MILDSLTENQRQCIVSLPYRAGLYVSQSDQSGGDAASDNEVRVLENLIYGFADGVFGSEFVQHVMSDTIKRKDQWAHWDDDVLNVPSECKEALTILSGHIDAKERGAYAARIMEVGEAVALAFREDIGASTGFGRVKAYMGYLSYKREAKAKKLSVRSFDDYLFISPSEREALRALARALEIEYV